MKLLRSDGNRITLELSVDEAILINNALNEVCNGIDVWEFETRLGSSIEEAARLLKEISRVLEE